MLIPRLASHIARASRFAECFLARLAAPLPSARAPLPSSYSVLPSSRMEPRAQRFHVLEPELEDLLVPRKMSITPLESWLTVQFALLNGGGAAVRRPEPLSHEPAQQYELPPSFRSPEEGEEEDGGAGAPCGAHIECKKIMKIRRKKMNKHQYKKRMKRTRFLRRKVKITRRKKKQKKFEQELLDYAKKFGLEGLPEGWATPKLYFGRQKSE